MGFPGTLTTSSTDRQFLEENTDMWDLGHTIFPGGEDEGWEEEGSEALLLGWVPNNRLSPFSFCHSRGSGPPVLPHLPSWPHSPRAPHPYPHPNPSPTTSKPSSEGGRGLASLELLSRRCPRRRESSAGPAPPQRRPRASLAPQDPSEPRRAALWAWGGSPVGQPPPPTNSPNPGRGWSNGWLFGRPGEQ